jgi:hypothetical protein
MSKVEQERGELTVSDLISLLQAKSDGGMGDWTVRLRVEKAMPSVGRSASVDVTGAEVGFDWNRGTVFLDTSKPLGLADAELQGLRTKLMRSQDALYMISRAVADERYSAEDRLKMIAEQAEKIFPPRKAKSVEAKADEQ